MKRGEKFVPLANCHVKGLFSIPLEVTDSWCRRMFIDTLGGCYQVAPHSHRYDLALNMVHGRMTHSIWTQADVLGALSMYKYTWVSPVSETIFKINGESAAVIVEEGHFELISDIPSQYNLESEVLGAGSKTVQMKASQIHSLVTTPGASWIITEYLDENPNPIALHHAPTYTPDLSGLYVPIEV